MKKHIEYDDFGEYEEILEDEKERGLTIGDRYGIIIKSLAGARPDRYREGTALPGERRRSWKRRTLTAGGV